MDLIRSGQKRFKYWDRDFDIEDQWLVLRQTKQSVSPPICDLMIKLGKRCSDEELLVDGPEYHKRMGKTDDRYVVYHISSTFKCDPFVVFNVQGQSVEPLKSDNLNQVLDILLPTLTSEEVQQHLTSPGIEYVKYLPRVTKSERQKEKVITCVITKTNPFSELDVKIFISNTRTFVEHSFKSVCFLVVVSTRCKFQSKY